MYTREEAATIARPVVEHCLEEIIIDGVHMDDDSTFNQLGLDSLDSIEVTMMIEEELDIILEDTDIGIDSRIKTVGQVIAHVADQLYKQKL